MISTMTRLPSESFWPTGAIDTDPSFSVESPLALPRALGSGYFDQITAQPDPSTLVASASQMPPKPGHRAYSPLSPGARGPALAQAPQFLSPDLGPMAVPGTPGKSNGNGDNNGRSTSLPPSTRSTNRPRTYTSSSLGMAVGAAGSVSGSAVSGTPPNAGPYPLHAANRHPRTASTDSSGAPSYTQIIRRLVQQNARIREAWEAERKYLEANRERAEEVYKEERALMEEERIEWETEKVMLLQELERLQKQVVGLGGLPARPKESVSQSLRGGGWETSPESLRSPLSSQGNNHNVNNKIGRQSLRNAVPVPQFYNETSPGLSYRAASASELPVVPEVESRAVPIVDVQEIHPELEGIPIKANTIQKPTFTFTGSPPQQEGSKPSSTSSSPPSGSGKSKASSKENTMRVLAVEESARLTMHAGHTPSHSLSVIPTVSSSGVQTVTSSGDSTPTMHLSDGIASRGLPPLDDDTANHPRPADRLIAAVYPDPLADYYHEPEEKPEPVCQTSEDRALKGPLMVRNMPAHDEIFFRRLSDKLEEVSKDNEAALPAVLKGVEPDSELEDNTQVKPETAQAHNDGPSSTAASDTGTEKSQRSPRSDDGEELEVPLKLRSSMNFGAPFGTFR